MKNHLKNSLILGLLTLALLLFCTPALAEVPAMNPAVRIQPDCSTDFTFYKNTGILAGTGAMTLTFGVDGVPYDVNPAITLRFEGAKLPVTYSFWNIIENGGVVEYHRDHPYEIIVYFYDGGDEIEQSPSGDYHLVFALTFPNLYVEIPITIHVVDSLPCVPTEIIGLEDCYTINPGESITIDPQINPRGWEGNLAVTGRVYLCGEKSWPCQTEDGSYVIFGDENEENVALTYSCPDDGGLCEAKGVLPGYYPGNYSLSVPNTNINYYRELCVVVLNENGTRPEHQVSFDVSTESDDVVFYEEDFSTNVQLEIDYDNALQDETVEAPVWTLEVRNDAGERMENCRIEGWFSQDFFICGYATIYGHLPVGDYTFSVTCTWFGTTKKCEFSLHRRENPYGEFQGIGGVEPFYWIMEGETVTIRPYVLPEGWRTPENKPRLSVLVPSADVGIDDLTGDKPVITNGMGYEFSVLEDHTGFELKPSEAGMYHLDIVVTCNGTEMNNNTVYTRVRVLDPDASVIWINETNFPDDAFRAYVAEDLDFDHSGFLTDDECSSPNGFYTSNAAVKSLKGIEYFSSLQGLHCYCTQLTSLDVSGMEALTELECVGSRLAVTAEGGIFDLSSLPGFDVTKASDWKGGTVNGAALTVPQSGEVTYTYDCGRGFTAEFTLAVTVPDGTDDDPVNKPGNVTGDEKGSVNGADALRLARFLTGQDVTINEKAADLNHDGKVDGRDLLRLVRYLAGQIEEL